MQRCDWTERSRVTTSADQSGSMWRRSRWLDLLRFCGMTHVFQQPQRDSGPLNKNQNITTQSVLTDTDWSKLGGHQRTGTELVVGRNWSPVKEPIRTGRLERGGSGSRGRGAGAHGRLRRRQDGLLDWTGLGPHTHPQVRRTWTMAGS